MRAPPLNMHNVRLNAPRAPSVPAARPHRPEAPGRRKTVALVPHPDHPTDDRDDEIRETDAHVRFERGEIGVDEARFTESRTVKTPAESGAEREQKREIVLHGFSWPFADRILYRNEFHAPTRTLGEGGFEHLRTILGEANRKLHALAVAR